MHYLLFVFIFAIVLIDSSESYDADLEGLVKKTPPGNSGVLRNCSSDQVKSIEKCYLEMFNHNLLNVTSLPKANEDPFRMIRLDATGMCRYHSTFSRCVGDMGCLNYNTFEAIFHNEIDSSYYLSQTAFLQFYCEHGSDFVSYYDCLETIDLDELSDTVFNECSVLEVGTCNSVKITTQCERSVFLNYCGHTSAMSYCQYFKVMERMTGWGHCEYMPCINSGYFGNMVFLLLYIVLELWVL
ncbi:hypothetical protein B9Z55_004678 [Caenorhabditis nigoni]|uniref:DUF19 domain-containing protein n=1 Tax=Caenorhabditis nigoni TaxID=1611254 RepID=A0A2G5UXH8_9PELO|nr:hypothetical protein B9Z55_004678 [Caenorhabditis nigoni]